MKYAEKGQVEFPELLFGMSWEDPESDRRALKIQPGEVVVTIGSGGCRLQLTNSNGSIEIVKSN